MTCNSVFVERVLKMFGLISKKKYDELNQKYEKELKSIKDELTKLYDINEYASLASSRVKGQNIINGSHNYMFSKEEHNILNLMSMITDLDLSYSNYLVQTQKGDWVVDVTQVPCTYEYIVGKLEEFIESVKMK